ncbi:uncharacterized protein LOC123307426 [Coccinella septempunctata]|uniref:uncharacterized protein LOC123307426 n=1 Tax=Coccinella septempunctata TaxID=41139 RepID=UPI001D096C60|nr:uncharacterized protein LOC123307426 [Coccinella septempunctata]
MEEYVEINLNHQGEDLTAIVPYETAQVLLNDPDAAKEFINTLEPNNMDGLELQNEGSQEDLPKSMVWSSKKPSKRDHDATKFFLRIRVEYSHKFDDRKTIKGQIWSLIAKKMNENGFYVGEGRDAVEKCRMKFANLQKQYLNHMNHLKKTGAEHKSEPLYFSEMHSILGGKDKVCPQNLQSTEENMRQTNSEDISQYEEVTYNTQEMLHEEEIASSSSSSIDSSQIKSRFTAKKSIKPRSLNMALVETMEKIHNENSELRKNEFEELRALLETQNAQRERFLACFQLFVKSQKRKRTTDSSEESS